MADIVSGGFGGRGSPNPLPNVNTLARSWGGGYGGGLGGAMASMMPWKKRLQGAAPFPGGSTMPGGEAGAGMGRPLTPAEGIRQPPGMLPGRGNGLPNLDPNLNIYREYPGFKPLTWHGDAMSGLDRMRGAKPEMLQQLSDAAIRLQGYSPMQRNVSGTGYGLSDPMAQFRKLLQARMGGV